jgi:hypothetical protein
MNHPRQPDCAANHPAVLTDAAGGYEPPRVTDLGTLTELTAGGTASGQSDGFGFAGGSGTLL